MLSWFKKLFFSKNYRLIKKMRYEINIINNLEEEIQLLDATQLQLETQELKQKLSNGANLDHVLHRAFALVREAAKRTLNQRHFDEQLIGGLILHRGMITEMGTGEGKTLVSTLPAYTNALLGKGVHIVTVNDYLAKRDAEWMGKIYNFLGLSVGCVTNNISDKDRQNSYLADITYATNNELGFDYLKDNMKFTLESKVQRPFYYAIIDEVDSILIDEARTPLIISGAVDDNSELYLVINEIIKKIDKSDYEKDEKFKTINLNESGIDKLEKLLIHINAMKLGESLYDFQNMHLVPYVNQALKANIMFNKDVDYIVKDNQIVIVDEFTGRMMSGRRYSDGLHQALEAKENLPIQNENQTLASITFQNYFRMYPKLAGMTGTAATEANEFRDIYNLSVVSVPPHKVIQRIDHDDEVYGIVNDKYDAILKLVKECNNTGQPVLVGTVSIEKSEEISKLFYKHNIVHNVLNAKHHEQEANIIAQAGRYKSVTIATNMAGRGTDIMLGGNSEMMIKDLRVSDFTPENYQNEVKKIISQVEEEKNKVIQAGGLFVIGTERHESRRIDNQLRGRSGRQGDPGATKFFLSLEDDLMRIFASDRIANMLRKLGLKNGEAIFHPMINRAIAKAQQKVEAHNYDIRKNLLKFDDVMNDQRRVIYQQRNDIISTQDLKEVILRMLNEITDFVVSQFISAGSFRENWNVNGLIKEVYNVFALNIIVEDLITDGDDEEEIKNKLFTFAKDFYSYKEQQFSFKILQEAERYILLSTLDQVWKEHLHSLDYLRQGISLRAYGQKDPLNEYKREAFNLFKTMIHNLSFLTIQRISHLHIDLEQINADMVSLKGKKLRNLREGRQDPAFAKYNAGFSIETTLKPSKSYVKKEHQIPENPSTWGKVGRNALCPCKSGKKYKHCHGGD